jgi:hypothetical protein
LIHEKSQHRPPQTVTVPAAPRRTTRGRGVWWRQNRPSLGLACTHTHSLRGDVSGVALHDGGLASHADGLTSRSVSSFAGALSACAEDVCISSPAHVEQCLVDEPHVQHSARRRSPLHLPAARWLHGAGDGGRGAGTVAAARVPLAAERPGFICVCIYDLPSFTLPCARGCLYRFSARPSCHRPCRCASSTTCSCGG